MVRKASIGKFFLAGGLVLLAAAFTALPAVASPARLIAPDASCLGLLGEIAEGAAARLEPCDGRAADQVWQMPARGFGGRIQLGGFCLDGGALQLTRCSPGGELAEWRHEPDGRLAAGGRYELCLDAAAGGIGLRACSGAAAQIFFAEGRQAWSPKSAALPADFLPIASANPAVSYARDGSGYLRSENFGRSFVKMWPGGVSAAFAVSHFDWNLLWEMSGSRLERSGDGGRSWKTAAVLPAEEIGGQVRIVPSRFAEQRVYVHGGVALWASHDRGNTFARCGLLPQGPMPPGDTRLLDLGGGALLFLRVGFCGSCGGDNTVLWRSEDDGASWRETFSIRSTAASTELLQSPAQPGVVYLSVRTPGSGESDRLLRSGDGGRTFSPAGAMPSTGGRFLVDRDRPGTLYLSAGNSLWRSGDDGASWQRLVSPVAFAAPITMDLSEYGSGYLRFSVLLPDLAGPKAAYFDSRNGGASFTRIDPQVADAVDEEPLPLIATGRSGWLYHRSGNSLQRSEDGGASWQNRGLLANALQIAADPHDPERLFARYPNGELQRSGNGGASFEPLALPAPASALAVFAEGDRTVVLAGGGGELFRSTDGGLSWTAPQAPPLSNVLRLQADGASVYAVSEGDLLYHSRDFGVSFTRRGSAEASLVAGGGLVAHAVRGEPGRIRVSTDGGLTYFDSYPPDQVGELGGIAIDELRNLYVSGETRVHRSANFGRTWQSFGRDLLAGSARSAIAVDPFDGDKLYRSSRHGLEVGRWDETAPLDLGPRFEARVRWRDDLGQTGEGRAQALTFDSGLFWIFNPGRAEVSVKVLDGRAINGRFWVFLASMTDVELDLQILDRVTGETWSYHNPLGRLASFGDVEAFPRSGPPDSAAEAPPARGGRLSGTAPVATLHGRFEVAIDWRAAGPSGSPPSGAGQGRRLGEETAAFYFFAPANVEVIVNLLDGRGINGKYWVYYGSMSDVEYVVRIKDLRSGLSRSYANLPGRLASVGDVEAFDE